MSPEEHITDSWNTRMEETSRKQRRIEASAEGGQGPEGAVAPRWNGMEWNVHTVETNNVSSIDSGDYI